MPEGVVDGGGGRDVTKLAHERYLFTLRSLVPMAASAAVLVTVLEASNTSDLFVKAFLPVYLLSMSAVAAASGRMGLNLGYRTEQVASLALAAFVTAGVFPFVFLRRAASREMRRLKGERLPEAGSSPP